MKRQLEYRNYHQAINHPAAADLSRRKLSQHVAYRIGEFPFSVSCILQIDDTRDEAHDYTQLWLSRSGTGQWNKIYQLPVPFSQFDTDKPDDDIIELVDRFVQAFVKQEGSIDE